MDAASFFTARYLLAWVFGLQLFRRCQMFFQPRQHFLSEGFQLGRAFGLVIRDGIGLFLEQLDGVFVSLHLIVGVGRVE